jgi:hypothetical protein
MNKPILFIAALVLILFAGFKAKAEEPNLRHIRSLLVVCMDNSKTTDSLYKSLAAIKNPPGVINAYVATLSACKAKAQLEPLYESKAP